MKTQEPTNMDVCHQTAKTLHASNGSNEYAYRNFGNETGVPLVFLMHFRGTMDFWDPLLVNTLAKTRPVILFDNAGVGQSTGSVASTIKDMAQHVIDFLNLIHMKEVDILGFSIGGYIAQLVALNAPSGLIRKMIIAASTPSPGKDIDTHPADREKEFFQLAGTPKSTYGDSFHRLFFAPSASSQAAGQAWWKRVQERNQATSGEERSNSVSADYADGGEGIKSMVAAMAAYKSSERRADASYDRLGEIKIPVFIGQGQDDFMIPTRNSFFLQQKLLNARLKFFPDSGHGFLYQYAEEFGGDVARFLDLP